MYFFCLSEHFEGVFVAGDFEVALAECPEDVAVVEFGLSQLGEFGVLLECEGEVVDGLLVALVG